MSQLLCLARCFRKVVQVLLLFDCSLKLDWAWIVDPLDRANCMITQTINMHSLVSIKVGSSDVAVEGDDVRIAALHIFNDIEAVSYDVRVLSAPVKQLDLLDCDESAQVGDLDLGVMAIVLQT